jgi:hypothetical protein
MAGKLTATGLEQLIEEAESSDPAIAAAARARVIALGQDRSAFADDSMWALVENLIASWDDDE